MAKNDLRWQRTERNLMAAFKEELAARPLDKISVTALAKAADINKATFYLHYRDVYDLAAAYARQTAEDIVDGMDYLEAFFADPARFVRCFMDDFDLLRSRTDALAPTTSCPSSSTASPPAWTNGCAPRSRPRTTRRARSCSRS